MWIVRFCRPGFVAQMATMATVKPRPGPGAWPECLSAKSQTTVFQAIGQLASALIVGVTVPRASLTVHPAYNTV